MSSSSSSSSSSLASLIQQQLEMAADKNEVRWAAATAWANKCKDNATCTKQGPCTSCASHPQIRPRTPPHAEPKWQIDLLKLQHDFNAAPDSADGPSQSVANSAWDAMEMPKSMGHIDVKAFMTMLRHDTLSWIAVKQVYARIAGRILRSSDLYLIQLRFDLKDDLTFNPEHALMQQVRAMCEYHDAPIQPLVRMNQGKSIVVCLWTTKYTIRALRRPLSPDKWAKSVLWCVQQTRTVGGVAIQQFAGPANDAHFLYETTTEYDEWQDALYSLKWHAVDLYTDRFIAEQDSASLSTLIRADDEKPHSYSERLLIEATQSLSLASSSPKRPRSDFIPIVIEDADAFTESPKRPRSASPPGDSGDGGVQQGSRVDQEHKYDDDDDADSSLPTYSTPPPSPKLTASSNGGFHSSWVGLGSDKAGQPTISSLPVPRSRTVIVDPVPRIVTAENESIQVEADPNLRVQVEQTSPSTPLRLPSALVVPHAPTKPQPPLRRPRFGPHRSTFNFRCISDSAAADASD